MDMQMPVMDGYTATRTIREWEIKTRAKPTPIIALSAYASKEEEEKSLGAGTNEHLTKPIKKLKLLETMYKYSCIKGGTAMKQDDNVIQSGKITVHVSAEIEDLIPDFLEDMRNDAKTLQNALDKGDYEAIQRLGHMMKGAGGGYGFQKITDIGLCLENASKDKNTTEIKKWIDELSYYLEHVDVVYEDGVAV